jgi:hypothetical protein
MIRYRRRYGIKILVVLASSGAGEDPGKLNRTDAVEKRDRATHEQQQGDHCADNKSEGPE